MAVGVAFGSLGFASLNRLPKVPGNLKAAARPHQVERGKGVVGEVAAKLDSPFHRLALDLPLCDRVGVEVAPVE
jgi:hypothetical protein